MRSGIIRPEPANGAGDAMPADHDRCGLPARLLYALLIAVLPSAAMAATAWSTVPVIIRTSDAAAPGRCFSVNGEGLGPGGPGDLALSPAIAATAAAVPPAGALHPQILQTDTLHGRFLVAVMPPGAAPGVYDLWVRNAHGWSTPWRLNAARALFLSEYQARRGGSITVVGRNLDRREFGGALATQARLRHGGGVRSLQITRLDPYRLTCGIDDQPVGAYVLEVSNDDGITWTSPTSGQGLEIVASTGSDPLALGAVWAQDFRWGDVIDVTLSPYGIDPSSGTADDTHALQAALDAAEARGGGVVFLPHGDYYATSLAIGSGVVIQGESAATTRIRYTGSAGSSLIVSKDGASRGGVPQLQGVARLSLLPAVPTMRPDMFINLGNTGAAAFNDRSLRTANRLFITQVVIDYPWDGPGAAGSGRGAVAWMGRERVVMTDNRWTGWNACNVLTAMDAYARIAGNHLEYAAGYCHSMATYTFCEDNTIVVHHGSGADSHGIFTRSDAYVAGNAITGAGGIPANNDGETISFEAVGTEGNVASGRIVSAAAGVLTVAPDAPLPAAPRIGYGELCLLITDGRGLGQLRRVAAASGTTITLLEPLDVVPDDSSRWTLYAPNRNVTICRNTGTDNAKGILGFGNAYDLVVADNRLVDTHGIFIWASNDGAGIDKPSCFTRIVRNVVTGVSRRTRNGQIGIQAGRWNGDGRYIDVLQYGTDIIGNTLVGDRTATPTGGEGGQFSGILVQSYGWGVPNDGNGIGDCTNTVIEGNHLSDLHQGILLSTSDYGQVVCDNTYDGTVQSFLVNQTAGGLGTSTASIVSGNALSDAPVITSPTVAETAVGAIFTYRITATGSPLHFAASGLPAGLSLDATTGLISGTPSSGGSTRVAVEATGSGGTGTATVLIDVHGLPSTSDALTPTGGDGAGGGCGMGTAATMVLTGIMLGSLRRLRQL